MDTVGRSEKKSRSTLAREAKSDLELSLALGGTAFDCQMWVDRTSFARIFESRASTNQQTIAKSPRWICTPSRSYSAETLPVNGNPNPNIRRTLSGLKGAPAEPPSLISATLPFPEERQIRTLRFPESGSPCIRGIFRVRRTLSLENHGSDVLEGAVFSCTSAFTRPTESLTPVQWRLWIVSLSAHVPELLRQMGPASILSSDRAGRFKIIYWVMHRGFARDPAPEPPGEISHRGRGSRHQR